MSRNILKEGLSGIMRVRNEARFLSACIDSCVNALDELIIVYNDCTDMSPAIIERKVKQYPGKIKSYPYNHNVIAHNLSKKEFEYAKSLPEDSLQLHSNQCNYALSKVTYKYAVKIDADQIYIESEVLKWRNICHANDPTLNLKVLCGFCFSLCFSVYRRISTALGTPCLFLLPKWFCKLSYRFYLEYARWMLINDKASVAWSGLNLFYDSEWFVPFDGINIHPPYNGEGDTMIFKVSDKTYFKRFNKSGPPYSVIELFVHPYRKMTFGAPVWFHLHANRDYCFKKVQKVKDEHPEWFLSIDDFLSLSYSQVHSLMNHKSHSLYQRILFAFVHNVGGSVIKSHVKLLNTICFDERNSRMIGEIPKVIHYCWFGRGKLPRLARRCIASWRKYLPEYKIVEWNEDNFDINITHYTSQAYQEKRYAFVSDYARYWVLYNYGGIYFDTDVEIISPMNDIISKGAFMGCETVASDDFPLYVNPGIGMGLPKGCLLCKEMLGIYSSLLFIDKFGKANLKTIVQYTTDYLVSRGLDKVDDIQCVDGIWIYPKEYFNPYDYDQERIYISNNTRTIHHFAGSWLTPKEKFKRLIEKKFGEKALSILVAINQFFKNQKDIR